MELCKGKELRIAVIVAQLFVYFILYSFLGWIWETVYCTVNEKHFQNRGFLFGPICPIYGVSVVIVQLLFFVAGPFSDRELPIWQLFLLCAVGSAVMEYSTSWYLEKRFHARWWDYSHIPLNVNGRICLPVTTCFGIGGIAIVRWILPAILRAGSGIPDLVFETAALLFMALFAADFALTEASLNRLIQRIEAAERQFSERAEAAYQVVSGTPQQIEGKVRAAQEEVVSRVKNAAASLSFREKYIVQNIRRFSPARGVRYSARVGEALLNAVRERGRKIPGRAKQALFGKRTQTEETEDE